MIFTDSSSSLGRRVWLLLLLRACARAGLRPISKIRLHRLIFLSNCLAPVYGERPLDEQIIKYKWGPFYPDAQWDVDRMAMQGLVALSDVGVSKDKQLGWWLHANYELLPGGRELTDELLHTLSLDKVFQFLIELASAYATLDDAVLDEVALRDATYSAPAIAEWAPIDFSSDDRNYSAITAAAFRDFLPQYVAPNAREQVQLYLRYLARISKRDQKKK